eukprot:320980-Pelagomonas_calceolata.AAC.4
MAVCVSMLPCKSLLPGWLCSSSSGGCMHTALARGRAHSVSTSPRSLSSCNKGHRTRVVQRATSNSSSILQHGARKRFV